VRFFLGQMLVQKTGEAKGLNVLLCSSESRDG
jgi:hypothetical protein